MTLAECRINDTGCDVSRAMTAKIVSEMAAGKTQVAKPAPKKPAGPTT
jgi:hypothetical protein